MAIQIELLDGRRRHIATARVTCDEPLALGDVRLDRTPADVLALFRRYEQAVNDQMFTLVDGLENDIADRGIVARFPDGDDRPVCDLQVFPATGRLSFSVSPATAGLAKQGRPT